MQVDVAIAGAGIVGLTTAHELLTRLPGKSIVVLEKEAQASLHQSGRNSGVIHSGIYYAPGSLKATNCKTGRALMVEFCRAEGIAHDICGKVIVATSESELPQLQRLAQRGRDNGVHCDVIDSQRLREIEPEAAGVSALWVPEAGIVDYQQVCARLVVKIQERGGQVFFGHQVVSIQEKGRVVVKAGEQEIEARLLINCAGLHSDRICALSGTKPQVQIVPFRGEYYELRPEAKGLVKNLIYPVPDPSFPFLGVHFTRSIHGGIECGPNAVLALGREAYEKHQMNVKDAWETLTYSGFLRLANKHWRAGLGELGRSLSKRAFCESLQRLVPAVRIEDLVPARSGIRAQALNRDGSLVDDFVIQQTQSAIHVCNAPSPAATSSFSIAKSIVDRAQPLLGG